MTQNSVLKFSVVQNLNLFLASLYSWEITTFSQLFYTWAGKCVRKFSRGKISGNIMTMSSQIFFYTCCSNPRVNVASKCDQIAIVFGCFGVYLHNVKHGCKDFFLIAALKKTTPQQLSLHSVLQQNSFGLCL